MATDYDTEQKVIGTKDEKLLQEIRDRYRYASDKWKDIRKEAQIDMRYISGDPWEPEDRNARRDAGRPCINHDELNQYCNQAINNVRQTPPGIKVEPAGNGASEKTAQLRQDLIRGIEYRSEAQSAYITAYENAIQRSYGFFRISRDYVNDRSDEQEIKVRAILNADSILYDPDCKEPDWSDAMFCYVLDPITKEEFKRRYPKAEKVDFSGDDIRVAKDWLQDKMVLIAEYWRVELKTKKRKRSDFQERTVVQYITNGVEILERNPQPGPYIPIIPVIGKELYVDEGSGPVRKLISMVRLARDPQMSLAYINSLEMEEAGLTPKVPYIGYVGQFETDAEVWDNLTKQPYAKAMVDPVVDGSNGVLPLPQRSQFTPNFAAYEVAKDSCRRAIMSAMGIMPLPTAAQRDNQKSGIALQQMQQQQAVGAFHFVSNLHRGMRFGGRVMEVWIPITYDTERDAPIRTKAEQHKVIRINTPEPYQNEKGEEEHYPIGEGDHDITISVGPSSESTREEAGKFLDTIVANMEKLPPPGSPPAKLLALAIKGKQLGVLGDQMAEIISPEQQQEIPPQAQAEISKLSQERDKLHAYAVTLEGEKQKLEFDQKAKITEHQFILQEKKLDNETKLAIAEVTTKMQSMDERLSLVFDLFKQMGIQQHQATMAQGQQQQELVTKAADQAHEAEMAQMQGQQQSEQSAQDHAQSLEQQDQAGQQALTQQQLAAEQAQQGSSQA